MFEREKSLLQTAIPVLKAEQYSSKMKKEIEELTAQMKELQAKKTHLELELRHNTLRLRNGLEEEEVKEGITLHEYSKREVSFIRACPVTDCRGFLSTAWKCEVCETWVCKDCHEIKREKHDEDHKCNENNVKSAELLMKETKPCPKCSARIHKIEGCNAMFCTSCKTCFNWKTGVITNSNSNPHFHEWAMRNMNKENIQTIERPCRINKETILNITRKVNEFFTYPRPDEYNTDRLQLLTRAADHIEDAILPRFMTNQVEDSKLLKYRIEYLKKEITPEVWKKNIFMIEKKFEYDTTIRNLYEVVMNVIRGSLINMSESKNKDEFEGNFKEIEYVVNYFNGNAEKSAKDFGYGVYEYLVYSPLGNVGRYIRDDRTDNTRMREYYSHRQDFYSTQIKFEIRKFKKEAKTPEKKPVETD
jgi:hypothetical protein